MLALETLKKHLGEGYEYYAAGPTDGKYDKEIEKEYISFLKKHATFVLKCDVFTKGRRLAFLLLFLGVPFYRKVVRYNSNRNKASND